MEFPTNESFEQNKETTQQKSSGEKYLWMLFTTFYQPILWML